MTTDDLQKLYIAYFNRPADPAGLQYWLQSGASLRDIANAFSNSTEYTSRFTGMDHGAVVRTVYLNLFGHDADAAGAAYWQDLLDKGALHVGDVVTFIFDGARSSDGAALHHKLDAANLFSQTLLTTNGAVATYTGNNANAIIRAWLDSINDVVDFPTQSDLQASVDQAIARMMSPPIAVVSGHVKTGHDIGQPAQGGTDTQNGQENQDVFSSGFDLPYFSTNQHMHGISFTEAHLDLTPPEAPSIHNAGITLTGIHEGAPA